MIMFEDFVSIFTFLCTLKNSDFRYKYSQCFFPLQINHFLAPNPIQIRQKRLCHAKFAETKRQDIIMVLHRARDAK